MISLLLFNYELFKSIIMLGISNIIILIGISALDYCGGLLLDLWIGDE